MIASRTPSLAVSLPTTAMLLEGRRLTLRGARAGDLPEVAAMHARCSRATLRSRYHGAERAPGRRLLERLLCTDVALLALAPGNRVVGMANLATAEEDADTAEVAVLVEDDWQSRGVGTALLRHLVGSGRHLGFTEVYAVAPARGTWAEFSLGRLGQTMLQRTPFGEAVVRLQLAPHHIGLLGPPALPATRIAVSRS